MTDTMPKLTLQLELERLYSKNQLIPRIRQEFLDDPNVTKELESKSIPLGFGIDLLVQMVLHKRANLPTMVGLLQKHFQSAQECADMLLNAAKADLVDWSSTTSQFIIVLDISEDVKEDLERYQFPLPMVIEPKELTSNLQSGYLLNESSVILKDNHHNDDVCLDHLNQSNKTKFCIDHDTATMIKNQWRNLDLLKQGETKQDYDRRVKAFEKYDRNAKDVMALLLREGNEFYLTHRYDKRGRTYCQGYHVNYQGNPWNKAVIQLADKELVQ